MKNREFTEVAQIWADYQPIVGLAPMLTAKTRFKPPFFEGKIKTAIGTRGKENPLLERRVDAMLADTFWNIHNTNYFQEMDGGKQANLYRLAVVAGYFMDPEGMHPEMANAVNYADRFI